MDNGYGTFLNMLEYKMNRKGKYFVKVDRFYPSSQTCHVCGQRGNRIERDTFICTNPECTCYNQAQDADMNAAINIAKSKDVIK